MTPTSPSELSTRDRYAAFLIVGLLFACYLLTYTGVIQSSDGLAMFTTAESMVRREALDSNQILWMDVQQGSFGPDGNLYNRKGLGLTLLALPLVWLARLWPSVGLVQAALLLNPLLTAWTGGLIYRTGRRLEWSRTTATVTALAFGLATLAWPYTQTFFSDSLSAWGLFAAFYCMLAFRSSGLKRYLLLGGIAWGLAYLSRVVNLLTLPIYLAALAFVIGRWRYERVQDIVRDLPALFGYNWRPFASFLIPVVGAGVLSLWWNWARFGSIWSTGYLESEQFNGVWLAGIVGLLFSPGRGIFFYSPILLLAFPGALWFRRYRPWILGMFSTIIVLYVVVYGKWYMWHGGFSWGPRFIVPTLPFLAVLAGPAFLWVLDAERRTALHHVAAIGVAALCGLSVLVQLLGLAVPFSLVQNLLAEQVEPLFAPETFTQWRYSPLVMQWQFMSAPNVPFWWAGSGDGVPFSPRWLGLIVALLCVGAGIALLRSALTQRKPDGRTARSWLYFGALVLLSLLAVQSDNLAYARTEAGQALSGSAHRIESEERAGDAILFLQPEQTQQFANVYHGRLPTFGMMSRGALESIDAAWLARLRSQYGRLWVVPGHAAPEGSGWEGALRADDFLLWEGAPRADSEARLALYALSSAQSLADNALGVIFGAADSAGTAIVPENGLIRLNGYALSSPISPDGEVLLTLRWESLQAVDFDFHVFVHVLDAQGQRVAQRDGQPVQWTRPTSTWQPGETITDRYGLLLSDDFAPGEYTISVGLYDPISGQRLPVSAGTGEYAIELGPLTVARSAK